ncbi:MAG: hypothetical protein KC418_14400 [Anaerolineales bacterium]|nr:hypothetical protein [Anaerolineales bacterium]
MSDILARRPARRWQQLDDKATAQWALWGGILFSLLFTFGIWAAGPWLDNVRATLLPDQGVAWYYWKLPEPTFWSRATVWGFYALHQITLWGLIYYAQTRVKKYTAGLHPVNVLALGLNAFFILLHFVQTHLWYDGLAQDVSIFSSQGSVILLLVLVLLMENPRRGLFFGKKAPLSREVVRLVRRYHGYIFAWAVVYTFWYHPMETTGGHLIGFFYTFLLLLQGSLFLTRLHVNKWWMLVQEVTVLFHGTLVAIYQGNGIWPMFLFGFAGIFVITQMHGLGWSRLTRAAVLAVYVGGVLLVYSQRGWAQLNEIVRIPVIDYLLVFLIAGILSGGIKLYRYVRGRQEIAQAGA